MSLKRGALVLLVLTCAVTGATRALADTTNRFDFTYNNRQALLANGWSFIATLPGGAGRNTEITNSADGAVVSYDQTAHPGVLRILADTGDVWGTANNTRNSLLRNLSSNWVSLRLDVSFSPSANYQQAQLVLYQDDDNYIEIGHAYSTAFGGEAVTLVREDGGVQTSWSPLSLARANLAASRVQLRLDRDLVTDKVSALYSLDGTNWVVLGGTAQAFVNPKVCLWTGGAAGGFPACDLHRLDIIVSATALDPLLVVQPQHLVFNAVAGSPCTNAQQLRVVARRAYSSLGYTLTNGSPWLLVGTNAGNTPDFCDVSVNASGLAPGTYEGTLTCAAPGAVSATVRVTLIVNPAVPARVATWRGAKAGAMSVWIDDSRPSAFDELSTNGFQGSYMLWDLTPIPSFFTNYYLAGMELGGHTVDHLCFALDEAAMHYEMETNVASICAGTPQPGNELITFAFSCGFAPIASQVVAADYFLSVHSYNVNQLEEPKPYNFMFLKSFNSHEHVPYPPADFKVLVDAAIAQGKWFNMVLHATNNSDGAISYSVGKDIWVGGGGAVTKYILQRERTIITNYQATAGQIGFTYYRLALDASSVRSFETAIGPQDLLTFQVDITGANAFYSVTAGGSPVSCSFKIIGGRTFILFDTPVTTIPQTVVLQLVPNRAPELPAQTNHVIHQLETLVVTNTATDPDAPPQVLTYTLLDPPAGAQIDNNGVIQWTPDVSLAPGIYALTTKVMDNPSGSKPLSVTNGFAVSVLAQNWLVLPPATNLTIYAGQSLVVTNPANDTRSPDLWTTNTLHFNYANRDALLADGWSFIATTSTGGQWNTEIANPLIGALVSYDQTAHPGELWLPCDRGDLWGPRNDRRNALFRNLPSNWVSLQLALSFAPSQDFQQTHLSLYQDDDNYLQAGLAFNTSLGGQAATLIYETNALPGNVSHGLYAVSSIYLRLQRNVAVGNVTGSYSLDRSNWVTLGTFNCAFVNPRVGIWAGGSPVPWTNGLPNVQLRQLDVVLSNNAPTVLAYTLLNPPAGAGIGTNGVITWVPTALQSPGTYAVTTVVADNGAPSLSATNTFTVIVNSNTSSTGPKVNFTYNLSANLVQLVFSGIPGRNYQIVWSSNVFGPWNPGATAAADNNGQVLYIGPGPASRAFFRVSGL